jgi:signal transduction histidine kinase
LFFKDLTHGEHKEEQERLKDRLAALGQMAANLAHEIRNPLASIEVSSSLLKRRLPVDAGERELLDKIIAEVRRLNRTITSSLEFVRPLSLSLAPAHLGGVLDDALAVAVSRRGKPGLRVHRTACPECPPFLMDRGQLRQVFENLFLNAMEAMGDNGTLGIDVSTVRAPAAVTTPYRPAGAPETLSFESYAVVRVSDTGPGIPVEHLEKLFYPFYTTKKHGSGVGLSIAKKIVDSHRGIIDVASTRGEGTTFTVRLPLVACGSVEIHV